MAKPGAITLFPTPFLFKPEKEAKPDFMTHKCLYNELHKLGQYLQPSKRAALCFFLQKRAEVYPQSFYEVIIACCDREIFMTINKGFFKKAGRSRGFRTRLKKLYGS